MKVKFYGELEIDEKQESNYALEYGIVGRIEHLLLKENGITQASVIYIPEMLESDIQKRFGDNYVHRVL